MKRTKKYSVTIVRHISKDSGTTIEERVTKTVAGYPEVLRLLMDDTNPTIPHYVGIMEVYR